MVLTVTSAAWRRPDADTPYRRTTSLRPQSHVELSGVTVASGTIVTQVWASLYVTDPAYVQKLLVHQLDARQLEWVFDLDGEYGSLELLMDWTRIDEDEGEVTLINEGVSRNLLVEIAGEHPLSSSN